MDVHALLDWYRPRRRRYPWRRARPDPYRVLVSEVMLQQTQATRVVPSFRSFMERFPDVDALAQATVGDVLRQWAGLGYNRRAVSLVKAARLVVRDHGGAIPSDPSLLASLPGVGPYTAAAVASLAFGRAVPAMDTNVRRVVARAQVGVDPDEAPPRELRAAADAAIDRRRPGAWNQALMDLGREVCRPLPRCDACPLAAGCRYRASGPRPGRRSARRPAGGAPFAGSNRQVRGAIVAVLRDRPSLTLAGLSRVTGHPIDRVGRAVAGLAADGLLRCGPSALAGRPGGRVTLPG